MTANSAAKGEATTAFTRVHVSELGKEASKLARVLASAHPQARLAEATRQLVGLARTTAATLEQLEHHPADRLLARRASAKLEQVAKRAETIGKNA